MKIGYIVLFSILGVHQSFSQALDSTLSRDYAAELAALDSELDTIGIFSLFDSVLSLAAIKPPSEFNVRLGYSSNVTNGGRDFGINQYGLAPGISFYHNTGLFADVSGFWNSEFDPKYNITVATLGYLGNKGKYWSYSGSYEKWIYHADKSEISEVPNNSISASINFNYKYLNLGLDYSYFFGGTEAHRLNSSIGAIFKTKKLLKNAVVSFQPSFSLLYGNQNVIVQFNGNLIDELRSNEYLRQNLQSESFQSFLQEVELTEEQVNRINTIQSRRLLTDDQKRRLISSVYLSNADVQNYIYELLDTNSNEYGIMNYNISFPVSIRYKKWLTLLSYSYNIPVELPGEVLDLDPVGLFSLTLVYRIQL